MTIAGHNYPWSRSRGGGLNLRPNHKVRLDTRVRRFWGMVRESVTSGKVLTSGHT